MKEVEENEVKKTIKKRKHSEREEKLIDKVNKK